MCVLIELLEEEFFEKIVNTNVDGNNIQPTKAQSSLD